MGFERTQGVVAVVKGEGASKSQELAELEDGGEIDTEELLAAQMQAKAAGKELGITFVAFTATPKDKTLQLFGTRPDPARPPSDDNLPAPFHVYSMRQAIEEGFILDVLQNYTSYKVAFNLAHEGGAGFSEVDRDTAMKGIMGWVRLHEYNIAQRVSIVVEHFRAHVAPLLGGQAKAMATTRSRTSAPAAWRWTQGRANTSSSPAAPAAARCATSRRRRSTRSSRG